MADDKSYKVVFHEDSDDAPLRFWVPGSPVQLVATQVFRSTATSKAYLQLKVRNIATTALDRFSWGAEIELEDGTSDHVSGDEIDLALAPRAERTFGPVELPHGLVTSVSVRIGSARLTDDTAWKLPDPAPNPLVLQELGLSVDAMEERNRKLREAGVARPERLRYRHVDSGGWWACSCGAANLANDRCASCGVAHDELASLEDEDALAEITRRRRENRQAKARKAGHAAKKVVPIVTVAVVACVVFALIVGSVRAKDSDARALTLIDNKDYASAYETASSDGIRLNALGQIVGVYGQMDKAFKLATRTDNERDAAAVTMTVMASEDANDWVTKLLETLGINASDPVVQSVDLKGLYYDETNNVGVVSLTCDYTYTLYYTFDGHFAGVGGEESITNEDVVVLVRFNDDSQLRTVDSSPDNVPADFSVSTQQGIGNLMSTSDASETKRLLDDNSYAIDEDFVRQAASYVSKRATQS